MIEIECLACGKTLNMPKYIDTDKYDGQVVCQECKSLLHIILVKGKVEKYRIEKEKFPQINITRVETVLDHGSKATATDKEKLDSKRRV